MKLIVITRPEFFVVEHLLIKALFNEGLDILHILKPKEKPELFERLLSLLPDDCREKIVLHDHFELKKKYGLMGIHLSKRNPEVPHAYRGSISCTCNSIADLKTYRRDMKYILLDPIFKSNSGDYSDQFTPSQLRAAGEKGLIDSKVIASGPIGYENISRLRGFAFGGVAVSRELTRHFNPVSSSDFKDEINYFRLIRRATE